MNIHKHCEEISWGLWVAGVLALGLATYYSSGFQWLSSVNFLLLTLLSSTPFALLGTYTRQVCKDKQFNPHQRKLRLFGVFGAFIVTLPYAIWSHYTPSKDAFTAAGFFWILSVIPITTGALIGIVVYFVVHKVSRTKM